MCGVEDYKVEVAIADGVGYHFRGLYASPWTWLFLTKSKIHIQINTLKQNLERLKNWKIISRKFYRYKHKIKEKKSQAIIWTHTHAHIHMYTHTHRYTHIHRNTHNEILKL